MRAAIWILPLSMVTCCWTSRAQAPQEPGAMSEVEVKAVYMSISKTVAAEWGLDGGPPSAPDKTPLGRAVPTTLSAQDAQKLVTALRRTEGAEILASVTVTTPSGNTAISSNVRRLSLPVAYDKDGQPSFGQAEGVGITLMVTATVEPKTGHVTLELEPELSRLVGYTEFGRFRMPALSVCKVQTRCTVTPGSTRLLTMSSPAVQMGSQVTFLSPEEAARCNDHVTVLFVAVDVIAD